MSEIRTKITAQGQISVPARIGQKLGVGPGSVLIWDEEKGRVAVRRAGSYTSEEIHATLFPDGPPERKSLGELRDGLREYIREYIRNKHESSPAGTTEPAEGAAPCVYGCASRAEAGRVCTGAV